MQEGIVRSLCGAAADLVQYLISASPSSRHNQ